MQDRKRPSTSTIQSESKKRRTDSSADLPSTEEYQFLTWEASNNIFVESILDTNQIKPSLISFEMCLGETSTYIADADKVEKIENLIREEKELPLSGEYGLIRSNLKKQIIARLKEIKKAYFKSLPSCDRNCFNHSLDYLAKEEYETLYSNTQSYKRRKAKLEQTRIQNCIFVTIDFQNFGVCLALPKDADTNYADFLDSLDNQTIYIIDEDKIDKYNKEFARVDMEYYSHHPHLRNLLKGLKELNTTIQFQENFLIVLNNTLRKSKFAPIANFLQPMAHQIHFLFVEIDAVNGTLGISLPHPDDKEYALFKSLIDKKQILIFPEKDIVEYLNQNSGIPMRDKLNILLAKRNAYQNVNFDFMSTLENTIEFMENMQANKLAATTPQNTTRQITYQNPALHNPYAQPYQMQYPQQDETPQAQHSQMQYPQHYNMQPSYPVMPYSQPATPQVAYSKHPQQPIQHAEPAIPHNQQQFYPVNQQAVNHKPYAQQAVNYGQYAGVNAQQPMNLQQPHLPSVTAAQQFGLFQPAEINTQTPQHYNLQGYRRQ